MEAGTADSVGDIVKYLLGFVILWAVVATVGGGLALQQNAVWRADRTRVLAAKDSAVHHADSVEAQADHKGQSADRLLAVGQSALRGANRLRDSLAHLPPAPDTCLPWLKLANQRGDSLQVAVDTLTLAVDSLKGARADLKSVAATLRQPITDLTHLAETAPIPHKWLGLLPKPNLHAGYGLTLWQGRVVSGVQVGVSFPIRW